MTNPVVLRLYYFSHNSEYTSLPSTCCHRGRSPQNTHASMLGGDGEGEGLAASVDLMKNGGQNEEGH